MLEFDNILYLGLRHPSYSIPSWGRMTTGAPAALREPPEVLKVTSELARLQGCRNTLLGPSTLHLFWDLLPMLAGRPGVIFLDAACYPIARWGVERAAQRGIQVRTFQHQDPHSLACLLACRPRGTVVILCDGISACSGNPSPLADYLSLLPSTGWLVVDDTQALGLLGKEPTPLHPYGFGGGGSARFHDLADRRLILASSLAKSFGTPVAVLAASMDVIERFSRMSETRMHCSPPALPEILAAWRALGINERMGDRLRCKLTWLVRRFTTQLAGHGLQTQDNLFPVQNIRLTHIPVTAVYEGLLRRGVRALLRWSPDTKHGPVISFAIRADHSVQEIDQAVAAILDALRHQCPNGLLGHPTWSGPD